MKPKIIIECKGGIIQNITANMDVTIINLDYDVMAEGPPPFRETFDDRKVEAEVYEDRNEFANEEKSLRQNWEKKMDEAFREN